MITVLNRTYQACYIYSKVRYFAQSNINITKMSSTLVFKRIQYARVKCGFQNVQTSIQKECVAGNLDHRLGLCVDFGGYMCHDTYGSQRQCAEVRSLCPSRAPKIELRLSGLLSEHPYPLSQLASIIPQFLHFKSESWLSSKLLSVLRLYYIMIRDSEFVGKSGKIKCCYKRLQILEETF